MASMIKNALIFSVICTCIIFMYATVIFFNLTREIDFGRQMQNMCSESSAKLERHTARHIIQNYLNNNKSQYSQLLWLLIIVPVCILAIVVFNYMYPPTTNNATASTNATVSTTPGPTNPGNDMIMIVLSLAVLVLLTAGIVVIGIMGSKMQKAIHGDYEKHKNRVITFLKKCIDTTDFTKTDPKDDFNTFMDKIKMRIAHVQNMDSVNEVQDITAEMLFDYICFENISSQNITPDTLMVINVLTEWTILLKNYSSITFTFEYKKDTDAIHINEEKTENDALKNLSSSEKAFLMNIIYTATSTSSETTTPISITDYHAKVITEKLQHASDPLSQSSDFQYLTQKASLNSATPVETLRSLEFLSNQGNGDAGDNIKKTLKPVSMYIYSVLFVFVYACMHFIRKMVPFASNILVSAALTVLIPIVLYIVYITNK